MSDFKLPELPSDDELGITDEDLEELGGEISDDGPEMSSDEMAALLGESSTPAPEQAREGAPQAKGAARPRVLEGGPRSRWRGPVTLALLLAVCVVSSSRTGLPRPVPANAPDTVFSSARAMTTLIDIARRPRPVGSPEHTRVRQLLVDRLQELGLEPQIQTAVARGEVAAGHVRMATVRNIVARLPGTASSGAVLITAHYDSRELAPGAADDGSGLVTILEALRALRAGPPVRNDIIVLFTDAEEECLCGAQAFVDHHPWIDDVSVVLSFEARGSGGPSIMFETNEQNGWIVHALEDFDPRPFANSMSYEVYRRMPNGTDFTEFKRVGKQGLNFATLDRAWTYHQPTDRPDNLSEATLQHHGLGALSALRYLGDADLGSVNAPDTVYFTVPFLGLFVYGASWVMAISGALLALALLAWLGARMGGARVSGVLVGLGLAILGASLSFGLALWLRSWVTGFYPEAGSLSGAVLYREGWWILAAAAGTFFIVMTIHGIARRWLTVGELALGATAIPLVLAVGVGFVAPLGAMNLQWPVAAALISIALAGLLGSRANRTVGWILTVLLAVPVLVLLEPLVELVWLAMTAQLIAPLAVVVAAALYLCLPALDGLRHPNSWWAPATGVIVAAGAFGVAVASAGPSAERPAPSTLVYAYEHGSGGALWATDPKADPVLDAEAVAWAEERAGGPFARTRDMADFGYPPGPMPVTDAPLIDAPRPDVQILSDSIEGAVRQVTLSVRSRVGAELLRFQRDPPGRTRILSVDGNAIEEPDSLRWLEHYGEPDSAGVVLRLRMPATEPIGIHVIEHVVPAYDLLGPDPFQRPADLMPDVNAMSDRAVFSYSIGAYADPRHAFMPDASVEPVELARPVPEATAPGADSAAALPQDSAAARPDSLR
jgi:hypothetical protein